MSADENEDIIAGMMKMYNRTNLIPLNLGNQENPLKTVAAILASSKEKHKKYNVIGFDPIHTNFLRKIVAEPILEKRIRTIREDYFRTVMYLSFFESYVTPDTSLLDDIKARTRELEEVDSFLDPNLEFCVRCTSFEYMKSYKPLSPRDKRRAEYEKNNQLSGEGKKEYAALRSFDPITEAAAKIYVDQIRTDEIKKRIRTASGISDLEALAFIDINLDICKRGFKKNYTKAETSVLELYDDKKPLLAAHLSIEALAKRITRERLSDYISTMQPTQY